MKTAAQVLLGYKLKHDSNYTDATVMLAMKEYAKEVINDILTQPEMIYETPEGAFYNYDLFEAYKKNLK